MPESVVILENALAVNFRKAVIHLLKQLFWVMRWGDNFEIGTNKDQPFIIFPLFIPLRPCHI